MIIEIPLRCKYCDNNFVGSYTSIYCSNKCKEKFYKKEMSKYGTKTSIKCICKLCKEIFYRRRSQFSYAPPKYCSRKCKDKGMLGNARSARPKK